MKLLDLEAMGGVATTLQQHTSWLDGAAGWSESEDDDVKFWDSSECGSSSERHYNFVTGRVVVTSC